MGITFEKYHDWTPATAQYPGSVGSSMAMAYTALGLTGEAGEVANQVKKIMRDDGHVLTPERRAKIVDELGDVFWYLSQFMRSAEIDPTEVLDANMRKLNQRQADGTLKGDRRVEGFVEKFGTYGDYVDTFKKIGHKFPRLAGPMPDLENAIKAAAEAESQKVPGESDLVAFAFRFTAARGPLMGRTVWRTFVGADYDACEAALRRAYGEDLQLLVSKPVADGDANPFEVEK